jgi:hypothetical protein
VSNSLGEAKEEHPWASLALITSDEASCRIAIFVVCLLAVI